MNDLCSKRMDVQRGHRFHLEISASEKSADDMEGLGIK